MKFIHYRHFVDVFMTEEEAKADAAEATIQDVDDKGQPITRPGILTDHLPNPYPNKKAAAAANNGAAPPDLSLMALARHGGDDYIFTLLTGYFDPPAGVKVDEGKAYNPYFPGGVISMPQQLFDEGIEYKDGTSATQSQQAKDVATFMHWAAEPFHDTRKRWGMKVSSLRCYLRSLHTEFRSWHSFLLLLPSSSTENATPGRSSRVRSSPGAQSRDVSLPSRRRGQNCSSYSLLCDNDVQLRVECCIALGSFPTL